MKLFAFLIAGLVWLLTETAPARAAGPVPDLPEWLPPPVGWERLSPRKADLGRRLFYDTRLSATGDVSCATCHRQDRAFSDPRGASAGVQGDRLRRNAPSLANVAYRPVLLWANPDVRRLEDQLLRPLFGTDPPEMGMNGREDQLRRLFRQDETYRRMFDAAFGAGGDRLEQMAVAVAQFQRTLISARSAYDRFRAGDRLAISPAAQAGADLFFSERLQCFQCHGGLHFTDTHRDRRLAFDEAAFHNTGLGDPDDPGLATMTGRAEDRGRFRTPSLRNVAVTAPYMHNGSVETLRGVIEFYAAGGRPEGGPDRSSLVPGFEIGENEIRHLTAFLESLTDEEFLTNPAYANPFPGRK